LTLLVVVPLVSAVACAVIVPSRRRTSSAWSRRTARPTSPGASPRR